MEIISGKVIGKVQNIMFRQTLIRGLIKRSLVGGATNHKENGDQVTFTISGDPSLIIELIEDLESGKKLNSWGAQVKSLEKFEHVIPIEDHEVTTENVDQIKWSTGVEFYL